MRITQRAEKVWGPSETIQKPTVSVQGTTSNATHYPARSRGGISGVFELSKREKAIDFDGSIWGWARRHRFSAETGYEALPADPDDE